MNEYKKAMTQAVMPPECEDRIQDMLTLGQKRQNRPVGQKIVRMAAAAAAAVLLLMGGTLAVSGGWSDLVDIFRERNGETYTETRIAQLTEFEEDVGIAAESEGITVTVDSVLTSDHSVDVLLRVSAPDMEWNEEWNYGFYNFRSRLRDGDGENLVDFADASTQYYCQYLGLDSESGEALVLFHYEEDRGAYFLWRDGEHALVLYLDRFYAYGSSRGDEKEIFGGEWELFIPLPEIGEENILHLGETMLRVKTETSVPGEDGDFVVVPSEDAELLVRDIWLTATTVCVVYERPAEAPPFHDPETDTYYEYVIDIRVVMKDGTVVDKYCLGNGLTLDGVTTSASMWAEPIDLTAIDYVEQNGQVIWKAE